MTVNAGKQESGRGKTDRTGGNAPLEDKETRKDDGPDASQEESEVRVTDRRRINLQGDPTGLDEDGAVPNEGPSEGMPNEGMNEDAKYADEARVLKEKLIEVEARSIEAERQVQEYGDRFRKAQAQMRAENDELRGRLQRNFEQRLDAARGDVVASLLETLDNLKRAIAAAETSERRGADFAAFLDGVRATAELFEARMTALGLTAIESEGEEFDPELHEAVETVSVAPEKDNRVISELQPGYRFGDRLLRPARVRVGRATDG